MENAVTTARRGCDFHDDACHVEADRKSYNARIAGELKSMGVVASTTAEFLNLPYGAYVTIDTLASHVEAHGESVAQMIRENPAAAAAAGVTVICAASTSCRTGLKNWVSPPVTNKFVVAKAGEVPKNEIVKTSLNDANAFHTIDAFRSHSKE